MAVFASQLLLTVGLLVLFNKLSLRYSFAKWLFTKGGIVHYVSPSNKELKEAIELQNKSENSTATTTAAAKLNKNPKRVTRQRKNRNSSSVDSEEPETFYLPRILALHLDEKPLTIYNLVVLPYYAELQWIIDFSLCTVVIYFITELYYFVFQSRVELEYNLSIILCLLALGFIIKALASITGTYFRGGDESMGERSICIVSGCLFFLISMFVLVVDEEFLEFGLVEAYKSFQANALRLLQSQGKIEQSTGPSSFIMLKFWLAIICGLIGMFFTFPGLRVARMHKDALAYAKGKKFLFALLNLTFISPLFIVILWIKPVARNYLTVREWPNRGIIMTENTFETVRLLFIVGVVLFRFGFFRHYLQAYLNMAPQKLTQLNKETGRISNIHVQKLIARVSYYLCVASLQFMAPLLLCLFMTLLAKSCGNYRWTGSLFNTVTTDNASIVNDSSQLVSQIISDELNSLNETILANNINDSVAVDASSTVDNLTSTVSNLIDNGTTTPSSISGEDNAQLTLTLLFDVFNPTVLRGLTGFMLWWTCTVWFTTSALGFVYHSYIYSN